MPDQVSINPMLNDKHRLGQLTSTVTTLIRNGESIVLCVYK